MSYSNTVISTCQNTYVAAQSQIEIKYHSIVYFKRIPSLMSYSTELPLRAGFISFNIWCIYEMCMSPALSGSSALYVCQYICQYVCQLQCMCMWWRPKLFNPQHLQLFFSLINISIFILLTTVETRQIWTLSTCSGWLSLFTLYCKQWKLGRDLWKKLTHSRKEHWRPSVSQSIHKIQNSFN